MAWRPGAGSVLMAAAVVGGLAYANHAYPPGREIVAATLREPSDLELAIGHLANVSLLEGQQELEVRCVSDLIAPNGVKIGGFAPGAMRQLPKMVILDTDICQGLSGYAKLQDKNKASYDQLTSLEALAHEVDHVKYREVSEAITYCRGFQDVYHVAVELGASKKQAKRAQLALATRYVALPEEYKLPNCYDEGPYDLNPGKKGVFPIEAPS